VVGLIGERGREVQEFVHQTLGPEGLKKAVVVVAPADAPPLMRMHGAMTATSIAEYFRAQGKQVLLLMDSLTRYAQAKREIALAVGEPPATKGYPPSVFAQLPHLVERAGNGEMGMGGITAIYTVLADGDDLNDPVVDSARGVLDGHFVLSRDLADQGVYPAIDIAKSVSRVMNEVVSEKHLKAARQFKKWYSLYQQNQDLVAVGAYQKGADAQIDKAIEKYPELLGYIQQDRLQARDFELSVKQLMKITGVSG
jgi:flagellum-specific ATP synthase